MLAAVDTTNGSGILCSVLLIAAIIAVIVGLAEALGLTNFAGGVGNTRFGALLLAVVLVVVYLVVC